MPTTFAALSTFLTRTTRVVAATTVAVVLVTLGSAGHARAANLGTERLPLHGMPQAALLSLDCPSSTDCLAVGLSYRNNTRSRALAERWNGNGWSVLAFPTGEANVQLNDVACPSVGSCIAVGVITTAFSDHPIAAHWDGSRWSLQRVPWPVSGGSEDAASLWGISCPARDACIAVGSDDDQNQSIAERWNGRTWALMRVAQPADQSSELNDISCTSGASCVAVGAEYPGCQVPFMERWNGRSWSITTSAPIPAFDGSGPFPCGRQNDSAFSGVSCVSSGRCMVVGWRGIGDTVNDVPLVESESSSTGSWLMNPFPASVQAVAPNRGGGFLNGVACRSTGACLAVGGAGSGKSSAGLVARLHRGRWSISMVKSQLSDPAFYDVACPTRSWCLAIGSGFDRHNHELPLAVKWG